MKRNATVRKAVFPAAGLGTRFLPATKALPKEMLPLVDKPAIQYVIEEAVASGIESIIIVTSRGKGAIEDHFDIAFEMEQLLEQRGKLDELRQMRAIADMVEIAYVRQKEPLGLGHAILVARDLVGDEPFAVFLGDDIIHARTPAMAQLIKIFAERRGSVLAVERVSPERTASYGIVDARPLGGRLHRVSDLVEKPPPDKAPSDLAIIGRYVLTPEIFTHLEKTRPGSGGEIQLTDGLRSLRAQQPIYAYQFIGTRYDTGNKLGFLQATVEFALRRPEFGPAFRDYLQALDLDADGLQAQAPRRGGPGRSRGAGSRRAAPRRPARRSRRP
jgi:UTP--glucose-1-phosphate uridylyltransferase